MRVCANRGCAGQVTGPQFTKCPPCLLGGARLAKFAAQISAVEALSPLPPATATSFSFRVPGRPLSWNHALIRPRHGRPFLSDEAREYKRAVALYAAKARPPTWSLSRPVRLELLCVFSSVLSDVDGPVKLVQDALQGIVYANDRQVAGVSSSKLVDPRAPRLEVTVRALSETAP